MYLEAAAWPFCAHGCDAEVDDRLSLNVSGAPDSSSAAFPNSQCIPSCSQTAPSSEQKSLETTGNHDRNLKSAK